MPTIEEVIKKSEEVAGERDRLAAELKSLKDKPDLSGVRRDDQGRVTAEWEEAEDITVVTGFEGRGPSLQRRQGFRANMKALIRQGYRPYGEFKSFGEFLHYGLKNGGQSERHNLENRVGTHLKSIQGLNETAGSDGGFTVMPEFSNKIFERTFDNNLWSETDNYTVTGNGMTFLASAETSRANGSRAGGLQGYWVAEGGDITKSKPTMREVNLKLGKLAIVVYLTNELLEDSGYALEQYVTRKAAEEFAFMQGDSLFNGINVGGQPLGLLNSPHLISVSAEGGQEAATIQSLNVEKMYARFFAPMSQGAKWYHNQDIRPQLNMMSIGLGLGAVPSFLPPSGLSSAPYGTLKGLPLQPTEFNPTLGTAGDLLLANMKQMLSINKGGVSQAVSMHVQFLTDQLALRFTMRCGARPWENTPLTPYKGSNTQSSAIALATRA